MYQYRAVGVLVLVTLAVQCMCSEVPEQVPRDVTPAFEFPLFWPMAHHDVRNSGLTTDAVGPELNGTVVDVMIRSLTDAKFYSAGVVSLDNAHIYVASSDDVVSSITVASSEEAWTQQLQQGTNSGVTSSPTVVKWGQGIGEELDERLFVASSSGIVYRLNPQNCVDESQCVEAFVDLGAPVYAPVRQTGLGVSQATYPHGVLYVSTSSPTKDSDGKLYQLDAATLNLTWAAPFEAIDHTFSHSVGLRYVPVIDETRNGLLYLAYDTKIVALNAQGEVVAEVNGTTRDPFVSSPSLSKDGNNLYVNSAGGYAWRIALNGTADDLTLTVVWACTYAKTAQRCCYPPLYCAEEPRVVPFEGTPKYRERRAARLALGLGPHGDPSVYPFATPSITENDELIVVNQYSYDEAGGVYGVDAITGNKVWQFFGNGSVPVPFGSSRSSPAIDKNGGIYVGTDALDGASSRPVLYGLNSDGSERWAVGLGEESDTVGSASPIVVQTPTAGNFGRVYMADADRVLAVDPGLRCPTDIPLAECSGHGICDHTTGVCECSSKCFFGDSCSGIVECNKGECDEATGTCNCPNCYNSQPDCSVMDTCGGHGMCDPTNGQCVCGNATIGLTCWGGANCTTECNGHGLCLDGESVCECNGNCYSGDHCQIVCNGNGVCGDNENDCACTNPCFTGPACQTERTCSGHGLCIPESDDKTGCICEPCWSGDDCETGVCSGHGDCVQNTCECDPCYSGNPWTCELNTCSNHGQCNPSTQQCQCDSPWAGGDCTECDFCHTGENCATAKDPCGQYGTCEPLGCKCQARFDGDFCERCDPNCYTNFAGGCDIECNGHGTCRKDASGTPITCDCDAGFYGLQCIDGHAAQHSKDNGGGHGGAIAAGILVPVFVIGAACGALWFYRKRNGHLPSWIPGVGGGSSSGAAAGGTPYAAGIAPSKSSATGVYGAYDTL